MLFKILLEPILALSLIRDLVQEFLTDIEEINIKEIYGCDGEKGSECSYFISGDQKIWILADKLKYDEAIIQCRTQKADLYYVRANHDLDQLMEFFNVSKIWTNVSKSRQGSLQDGQGFYPELMGKFRAISLENFNLAGFTNKARIVLTCELGLYEMKIVPDSEPQDALCFQPLKFPYRESDQANLLFLKKTYTVAIQAHLQSFEPVVCKA